MNNIFDAIKVLYSGNIPKDPPSDYVLNRFLASNKHFAQVAKAQALVVRDRELAWGIWQVIVPVGKKPPWFKYVGPNNNNTKTVSRIQEVMNVNKEVAAEIVDVFKEEGEFEELCQVLGVVDEAN